MNKKGFTLIELLAVIVVLGLVLVVTVPTIINNMNSNRLNSLLIKSQEYAKWYNEKIVENKLSGSNKLVKINDNNWHCIRNIDTNNLYGLDDNIKLDGTADMVIEDGKITNTGDINNMCSSIRLVNNKAEVILIAETGGAFDTNGSFNTYAISSSKAYDK